MANYKNVRLEEHVYQELVKRMKPRESMSQVIERLIINLDQVKIGIERLVEIFWEGKPWNTKR